MFFFFFHLLPVGVCIDACVTIRSYVLCVHSLITRLQVKKMSVMYESAHDAITFHLLEMSSITTRAATFTKFDKRLHKFR